MYIHALTDIVPISANPLIDLRGEAPPAVPGTYKDGGAGGKSSSSLETKSKSQA